MSSNGNGDSVPKYLELMKTKDEQEDNQIDSQTESAKEIISQDTDVRTKDEEINS